MTIYKDLAIIVLAAGKGTRMKSDKAKVLHQVAGMSMISRVVSCAVQIASADVHVVVGHQAQQVKDEVRQTYHITFAHQAQLLGTGDAVKSVLPNLSSDIKAVLVLCGDVPLIQKETLTALVDGHKRQHNQVTVLATRVQDPTGYGRIILDQHQQLICIREEADANENEKKIHQVNTGIYCFDRQFLEDAVSVLKPDNNQGEYYLTDVIEIAQKNKQKTGVVTIADWRQVIGVNTLEDLDKAQSLILQSQNELP